MITDANVNFSSHILEKGCKLSECSLIRYYATDLEYAQQRNAVSFTLLSIV